jgi:molybdate transport system ATP-binding protein
MRVRLVRGASEIETPLGHAALGTTVRLAIRAGDILLATERPHGLSARNVIAGKIISLEQRGTMFIAQVAADADAAVVFTVHLTLGAKRALELEVNRPVWLVLKTYSCHVLED